MSDLGFVSGTEFDFVRYFDTMLVYYIRTTGTEFKELQFSNSVPEKKNKYDIQKKKTNMISIKQLFTCSHFKAHT